jgi:hypothetical protein
VWFVVVTLLAEVIMDVDGVFDLCDNSIVQVVDAPGGRISAVVFERSCGATTEFSTQVSVVQSDAKPSDGGNVFVADDNRGSAAASAWGGPWVDVRWRSAHELIVRYDAASRVYKAEPLVGGIEIMFEKVSR